MKFSACFTPTERPSRFWRDGWRDRPGAYQRRYWLVPFVLGIGIAVGCGWLVYQLSQAHAITSLRTVGDHRLDLLVTGLEREMGKYAYFPAILNLKEDVHLLLEQPGDKLRLARVNAYLESLNQYADTLSVYIVNPEGIVVASSNWRQPDSYIGEHLIFRPYVTDALQQGIGRFFGIGTTRGEPGYYLAQRLNAEERVIGVAVVKIGFEQLQDAWSIGDTLALVSDDNDVIFLSTVPAWRFTTLKPLDAPIRKKIAQTLQYSHRPLTPLHMKVVRQLDADSFIARFSADSSPNNPGIATAVPNGLFLGQTRTVPTVAWHLTVFLSLATGQRLALNHAVLAGVSSLLILLLLWGIRQRRRYIYEQLAARTALQQAHDGLERKVAERTIELSAANERLRQEIDERARIEQRLRATQEEMVQAAKLAVIGQLSAEIVHELNQPLAALRTLAGNTVIFLRHGNLESAYKNLDRTDHLIQRMAKITEQLKSFARKSSEPPQRIAIRQAVDNSLMLLEQRLRKHQITVRTQPSTSEAWVWGNAIRLEQVLINLLSNAVDASADVAEPVIEISWEIVDCLVLIQIRDSGIGLSETVQAQLFKPFFTTKDTGQGLGLGLAISADILHEFGGRLSGANRPEPGAVFTVELPLAPSNNRHAH